MHTTRELNDIIDKFDKSSIIVIGDLMLDKFIYGNASRISPEAPVPVVLVEKEVYLPGGAANTANNISSLEGKAYIAGVVGNDDSADILTKKIDSNGINRAAVLRANRQTTVKERVIASKQQVVRLDYETMEDITEDIEKSLVCLIEEQIGKADIVVLSDYAKGLFTKNLTKEIKLLAATNKKRIIASPKPKNSHFFDGCDFLIMNNHEAEDVSNIRYSKSNLESIAEKVIYELNCPNLMITCGADGMFIYSSACKQHIPTNAREVYDVTGAGDTVAASLAISLASGASFGDAALISNYAAGIVVGKIGTATLTRGELRRSIETN